MSDAQCKPDRIDPEGRGPAQVRRQALPDAQFTEDMDVAKQSVVKLGRLTFETLLVGHGDPIEAGASGLVAELAAAW